MAKMRMGRGEGIGVGIALGVALGAAFGHIALGVALGVAFGAALDWGARSHDGDDANSDSNPISNDEGGND